MITVARDTALTLNLDRIQMPSTLWVSGATGPHARDINGTYVHAGFQNQVNPEMRTLIMG